MWLNAYLRFWYDSIDESRDEFFSVLNAHWSIFLLVSRRSSNGAQTLFSMKRRSLLKTFERFNGTWIFHSFLLSLVTGIWTSNIHGKTKNTRRFSKEKNYAQSSIVFHTFTCFVFFFQIFVFVCPKLHKCFKNIHFFHCFLFCFKNSAFWLFLFALNVKRYFS